MKKNVTLLIAALTVLFTGCKEDYIIVTDPKEVPSIEPGMVFILPAGLPSDLGINIFNAAGNHHFTVVPGVGFNLNAGDWSAVAYSPASGLGGSHGNIVNLPVSADGEVSQIVLTGCSVPFTIWEDIRLDLSLNSFRPMTRQLVVPLRFQIFQQEDDPVTEIRLRVYGVGAAVDVSKGFGHVVSPVEVSRAVNEAELYAQHIFTNPVVDAENVFTGFAGFTLAGFSSALPFLTLRGEIRTALYQYDFSFEGSAIAAAFNSGPALSPYIIESGISLSFKLDEAGGSITPWEPDDEIEIPGM